MRWYWILIIILFNILLYFVIGAALCGILMRYQDKVDWLRDWKIDDEDEILPCCLLWPFMLIVMVVVCLRYLLLDKIIEFISGKRLH